MSKFVIDEFDVSVTTDVVTPAMLWESRFIEFERTMNSQRIYMDMDPDHRFALSERVKRAVAVMYDTTDEWIPDALSLSDDGTCIKIEMNLVIGKIDVDVENKNRATTFKLLEVKKEIEDLLTGEENDNRS